MQKWRYSYDNDDVDEDIDDDVIIIEKEIF